MAERPKLVIEYEIGDLWFDDVHEMRELGDAYLLELLAEDWTEVIDGATKRIVWPGLPTIPESESKELTASESGEKPHE